MRQTTGMGKQLVRTLEFVILFFGIPLLIFLGKDFIHSSMIINPSMIILPLLVFIFIVLKRSTDFKWRELLYWGIPKAVLWMNGAILLGTLMVMLGYMVFFEPEHLFDLPRANPWIYVAMCVFYPVFSAFGQEVIYRTFLFRRYGKLFKYPWITILASGITFSFVHIVYFDPVSMVITFLAGIWFAMVYQQTRSVLYTAVLHGVAGVILFGVGLGRYFWLDMPL
jgi:membrane protease YdiL (CAAX protease family)